MMIVVCLIIAYVLGSIPSAYYAGKWIKGVDLRTVGSGNLGFTNAWRVLGPTKSIPVLLVDAIKGIPAILFAYQFYPQNDYLAIGAGLLAILGHSWSLFLGFRGGGKGVAVSIGVFLILTPICFLTAFAVFLPTLLLTRYMSLASILGAITLVAAGTLFLVMDWAVKPSPEIYGFMIFAALLVIVRHHSNIKRLLRGEEHKFGKTEEA